MTFKRTKISSFLSGISLEPDFESGSQVIEVEESEAIEAIEFADAEGEDVFGSEEGAVEVLDVGAEQGISLDEPRQYRQSAAVAVTTPTRSLSP